MPPTENDFAEHIRSRTVKPPAVVYKYTDVDTARLILTNGTLRYQSPLRYNDPFDSQWNMLWPMFTDEAKQRERHLIEQSIRDPGCWPADADPDLKRVAERVRTDIEALAPGEREEAIARVAREYAAIPYITEENLRDLLDLRRRMRVLCFSATDSSILMWSHYAAQHRGVVLGFNSLLLELSRMCPAEIVEYLDGPPTLINVEARQRAVVFGCPLEPEYKDIARRWALTKYKHWAYEQEWRMVSIAPRGKTLGDFSDFKFPREALRELVIGSRTDRVRAKELRSLTFGFRPDVAHFEMAEHTSRFELIKTRIAETL